MSGNVIRLEDVRQEKESHSINWQCPTLVWKCPCGNTKFLLSEDGTCECSVCGVVSSNLYCGCSHE